MSYTLPPLKSLFELADTHTSRGNDNYSDFSRILVGGVESLEKRAFSQSLGVLPPCKKQRFFSGQDNQKQLKLSLPLPHEIHNYILETFWDHKEIECSSLETIRACALTCKIWHTVARRHVFRVIILKSWGKLQRFDSLVVNDKSIIRWIQRVRLCGSLPPYEKASAGQTLPPDWGMQDRWIYHFPYSLALRIRDQTGESLQPFNIKIFELFDFSHISGAVEDCQWFAFWLRHLQWLESVETLYLRSCEMASNAMSAFSRSFPRLRRVGLTHVDFSANNHAIIHNPTMPPPPPETEKDLESAASSLGMSVEELLRKRIPRNGVSYAVINPRPLIESLFINNASSQYGRFNLLYIVSWARPSVIAQSLRSLEISVEMLIGSVSYFINNLGPNPVLEHLRMWAGYDLDLLEYYEFDFSKFTNLKSLALHGGMPDDTQVEAFLYILSSLKAPELQKVTLTFTHDDRFTSLKQIDNYLSEKFRYLEAFVVECVGLQGIELEEAREELEELFPQMERRNMLSIQSYVVPFRY